MEEYRDDQEGILKCRRFQKEICIDMYLYLSDHEDAEGL